jgi:hypothetical protein
MSVNTTRKSVKITRMSLQITRKVPKTHACCDSHTHECGIASFQNPIRIFFGNLMLILVCSF